MELYRLILGSYQVNCYLCCNDHACVIVDPGYEPETVSAAIEKKGLKPEAILLTHGHFDHVGAVKALSSRYSIPVYLHPADLSLPLPLTRPMGLTEEVDEGDELHLAGLSFRVMHTPGHSAGSVCYVVGDVMFSGDTLFAGSRGRTDLPGGSDSAMRKSLNRLAAMTGDYHICPGHGEITTLSQEQKTNPYL